jgi:membrane fusion protein (multidrug efflux system)
MTRIINKVSVFPAEAIHSLRTRALVAVAASVVAFSLAACGDGASQRPPQGVPEVGVQTIAPHPIVASTELSGRLSAVRVADVRPQVQGIVMKRLFSEGSMVAAGAVLYQIDPAAYQASYDQAVGTLVKAQATADAAQTKATRYADLSKIDGVSKQDYDDAISSLQEAKADVVADRAALKTAAINLGYTKIVAPIAGRIGKSSVTEGALVTAEQTTALATVQATIEMYLDATRSSVDWLRLQKEFASGKLLFSDITVDATTGSVTLRSVFPNPEGALLPGMFVRARLEEGVNQQAITVPQLAVSHASDGSASVLTVSTDSKVLQTSVTTSSANGTDWIVTSGLKAGDRVIVSGSQKTRTGALVKAVESPSPSDSNSDAPATVATAASATRS